MTKVEKYGLLALFVLCALILGVGVFGSDNTANAGWRPSDDRRDETRGIARGDVARSDASRSESGRGDLPDGVELTAPHIRQSGNGLERVPLPNRDRSFPPDAGWGQPRILEGPGPQAQQAQPAPAPTPVVKQVRVRDRDTFEGIALREYGSRRHTQFLMDANPGVDPRALREGQMLNLPDPPAAAPKVSEAPVGPGGERSHTVRKGDTLERLSRRYYRSPNLVDHLASANGMKRDDRLLVGRVLRIPPDPATAQK